MWLVTPGFHRSVLNLPFQLLQHCQLRMTARGVCHGLFAGVITDSPGSNSVHAISLYSIYAFHMILCYKSYSAVRRQLEQMLNSRCWQHPLKILRQQLYMARRILSQGFTRMLHDTCIYPKGTFLRIHAPPVHEPGSAAMMHVGM